MCIYVYTPVMWCGCGCKKWTNELWTIFFVILRQNLSIKDILDTGTSLKRTLSAVPTTQSCVQIYHRIRPSPTKGREVVPMVSAVERSHSALLKQPSSPCLHTSIHIRMYMQMYTYVWHRIIVCIMHVPEFWQLPQATLLHIFSVTLILWCGSHQLKHLYTITFHPHHHLSLFWLLG